jgi:hypothetical protein
MSNKEKNKEPYLLQDEKSLDELKNVDTTIIEPEDQEKASKNDNEGKKITDLIKKAKPENVKYQEDGSIEITNEGDLAEDEVNEYKETEGFHFDKLQIKGQDEKKFLEFLQAVADGKVDVGSVSLGAKGDLTIQKAHYDPTLNKKGKILTNESFKKLVNNFNRINLSESDIINILEETQNPTMTKSELLETIQNNLISEANMNDNVRQNFESGENDYQDILGGELTNQLAQEAFQEIADDIRRKTGKQNVTLGDVQNLLGTSLMAAAKEEYRIGTESLERKAVDMIRKQYNIPADAVEFDAKIVGLPPQMLVGGDMSPQQMEQLSNQAGIKVGKINREGLKMSKGDKQPPQGKSHDELKPQIKRRRLTNAMMHGAARKSQNLHHLDDQLRDENPQLGRNYANLMAANDANYFLIDDETIKREGESGIHAGNVRVDLSNREKPKIIAQGMVFPILLHELSKGVVELMSLWGLPEDAETRRYVLDKTDNLSSETNDIRLGTKIWERFVSQIPVDNQEVISLTWNMLQELPDTEYNNVIEGLIQNSTNAEQKVRRLADEALEELRKESSDDVFGGYDDSPEEEDDGDTLTPPEEEGGREVTPSPEIDEPSEPSEPDYERMSKRELEREIDSALDTGDMELVRHLGSILNKK